MKNLKKILIVLTIALSSNAFGQTWGTKSIEPKSRFNSASCVLNNLIYILGGSDSSGNPMNTLQVYDPSTNTWVQKASMNVARGDFGLAAVNGKLYAIGGYSGGVKISTVEEYNPTTDTWSNKTDMPTSRSGLSVGVINNKIYAVGGWSGNYTTVEEYNPAIDSWATKSPIPQGRGSDNSIQVIGNNLYYIAGKNINSNAPLNTCYKYNQLTDTWSSIANIPQAIWAGATAVIGTKIHYFGGGNGNESSVYNYHFVYDTLSDTWTSDTLMTSPRADFNAETMNGTIYLIGGRNPSLSVLNLVEAINYATLTGIESPNNISTLKVYPNPATDHIYINNGNYSMMTGYSIKITNSLGQSVFNSLINQQVFSIDLNMWSGKGLYIIKIYDAANNLIETRKILLE